ncbi:MAG: hypothetical protein RR225_07205, partial [Clostridium sp.]
QALCGLKGILGLFNCQTSGSNRIGEVLHDSNGIMRVMLDKVIKDMFGDAKHQHFLCARITSSSQKCSIDFCSIFPPSISS